jgi:RNA polymerase sigma-70 factor (ECF subfamily)
VTARAEALPVESPRSSSDREFAAIYRTNIDLVRRVIRRYRIHSADWDDAIQDVFVVAHRRWNQLNGADSLRAWLHGIARRVCANYRRSRKRWHSASPLEEWRTDVELHHASLPPTGHFVLREEVCWLRNAVNRLDEKQRTALVLTRLQGRSAAELSRSTGLSPNTIESRVRAAMKELRLAADTARELASPRPTARRRR